VNRADWDHRYAGTDLVWSAEPNRFLVEEVSELPPGRALDVAAGEGRNAVWLAGRGFAVDAVDFSEVGMAKGRALAGARGVDVGWIVADVETWPVPAGRYDLVILFYLQLPLERMRGVVRRYARAVAPGGTFLLVGHDRTNLDRGWGGPRDPEVLYGPDDLVPALAGLRLVEADRRRRAVATDEGERVAIDCLVRAVADAGTTTGAG